MNFKDTLLSAELVIKSNEVPLIVGESGIGKTALAKELSIKNDWRLVVIDGNLLKEGEIGGLPTIEDYTYIENEQKKTKKRTVYAVHTKLQEIENLTLSGQDVLLFIDEINRCEHTVQQELMNLILNREINGYHLNSSVKILAAMNPSSKYGGDFDYQVVDMDPAQEDRFVWLYMESDANNWIRWASNNEIEDSVIEFISTFPNYLSSHDDEENIQSTPRSFERVSKCYKIYKESKGEISKKVFLNVLKGNLGNRIASEFMAFIEEGTNPLINYKDVFNDDKISNNLKARVQNEPHTRLYLSAKNILKVLDNNFSENEINRFVEFLNLYPLDLKIGVMQEIKQSYSNFYKVLIENDEFIEMYFDSYNEIVS